MIATAEYELATSEAALVDRSYRGKLRLTGADVAEFLQGQVSNDVEALGTGEGCYATLLNHKGKVRADLRILHGDDWFLLDFEPQAMPVFRHMVDVYGVGRDVQTEDVTESVAILSVIGPAAHTGAPEHSFREERHGLKVATDLGYDLVRDAREAGAARERLGLREVPEEVAECLRIESGRPRLGFELGDDVIPQEAGINERAISFTKGCYVGQETVARLFYKGKPNRHLRGLRLAEPAGRGEPVWLGERQVGVIGSSCVSPAHGPIALALIRREAEPGATVEVGDGRIQADVVELPF